MTLRPMSTHEFYAYVFTYRLDIHFAKQRYDQEVQALERLKAAYDGRVPQVDWDRQRRRVKAAYSRLAVRRSILHTFLEVLNN
jgi:hypothetical protein